MVAQADPSNAALSRLSSLHFSVVLLVVSALLMIAPTGTGKTHTMQGPPGDPDPQGKRLAAFKRALEQLTHIEGLFWDFASVPQKDERGERNAEEAAMYRQVYIQTAQSKIAGSKRPIRLSRVPELSRASRGVEDLGLRPSQLGG